MYDRIEHIRTLMVTPGQAPERVDVYITRSVLRASRSKVQEAIESGAVLVNGKRTRANYRVRPGDEIVLTLMKPPPIILVPQDIPIDVVYEDEYLLVVNKPAGMVTHPGFGNRDGTLVNAVLHHVGDALPIPSDPDDTELEIVSDDVELDSSDDESVAIGAGVRPGIVHRLDKDTSGLLVVAKDAVTLAQLARQFADRSAHREYYGVVWGAFEAETGEIDGNIARDSRDRKRFAVVQRGGKHALTSWRVVERFEFATAVACRLATGRTHQIRVHMAHIHHPLFGDATYGGRATVYPGVGGRHGKRIANLLAEMTRQALHGRTLGFVHPATNAWIEFESALPDDIRRLVERLRGA